MLWKPQGKKLIMNRNRLKKLTHWGAITGTIAVVAFVWVESVLRPLAISDSVVHLVRNRSEKDVYADVAHLIQEGQINVACVVTALGAAIVSFHFLNLWWNRDRPTPKNSP